MTERYYHTLLLVLRRTSRGPHDIEELVRRAAVQAGNLAGALPRTGAPEEERLFQLLKRAYIDARYSKSYRIEAEELGHLAERVRELAGRIREACMVRMEGFCGKDAVSHNLPGVRCSANHSWKNCRCRRSRRRSRGGSETAVSGHPALGHPKARFWHWIARIQCKNQVENSIG